MLKNFFFKYYSNLCVKRVKSISTLSQKEKIRRKERDTRHFIPANKEWKDSIYNFNKNNLYTIPAKDKLANKFIKSYFTLIRKSYNLTKSKRSRDLQRIRSTKQFYVSKPELKQNNDKVIVNLYTFDRENAMYMKRLYYLKKLINSVPNILLLTKFKSKRFLIRNYNVDFLFLMSVFNKIRKVKYRYSRKINKKFSHKLNKRELFYKVNKSLLKNKYILLNTLYFHFFKWILSILNITVVINSNKYNIVNESKELKEIKYTELSIINNEKLGKKDREVTESKKVFLNELNIEILNKINLHLLIYLISNIKILNIKKENIYYLFNIFKNKYLKSISKKILKKEILIMKYLNRVNSNKFKFFNYLPVLKSTLSKIYDKKIQINIVNLKYFHLNSDLYSEALSIKLRPRTISLYKVLIKSMKFFKSFKPNNILILSEKYKNFKIKDVNTYFGKFNVINGKTLNMVFRKMFNNTHLLKYDIKNTLISIKYKWVTGARVEAAGRLTKRYAAARAVFKYKYRGTLKNLEHLRNVENKIESPSIFMVRGNMRPNIQYSFTPAKRRIGAFGIKSWISNS